MRRAESDRLIAAAVAAKDRELADVRNAWRADRGRLTRARIALEGIATLRGSVMTVGGRVEAAERMREIARGALQHIKPEDHMDDEIDPQIASMLMEGDAAIVEEARSLLAWLDGWGDGPNWSDASGATVPVVKASLRRVLRHVVQPLAGMPTTQPTGKAARSRRTVTR